MSFFVHTLEYTGPPITDALCLKNYTEKDYIIYKHLYEDSFYEMRSTLGLPRECCKSSEKLKNNKDNIFVLEEDGNMIGSVSITDNEIDDLFVARKYQHKGYGLKLLRSAVSYLQRKKADKIILHVADVNKSALSLYLGNGFVITNTEEIRY